MPFRRWPTATADPRRTPGPEGAALMPRVPDAPFLVESDTRKVAFMAEAAQGRLLGFEEP